MDDQTKREIMDKLQAPFDEKDRIQREYTQQEVIERGEFLPDEPPSRFPKSVYEQRLDDVFGLDWDVERDGSLHKITARLPNGDPIIRVGDTFQDACEKFGIGRYLHPNEEDVPHWTSWSVGSNSSEDEVDEAPW